MGSESKKLKCVDVINHLKNVQSYHEQVIAGRIMPKAYEDLSENEKSIGGFLLLIDKLAMAYLKNRERLKSIQFVEDMYDKGYVNDLFKEQMLGKLESLWEEIYSLHISANLEETRGLLDKILPVVKKEEESLFVTLFAVITSQSS